MEDQQRGVSAAVPFVGRGTSLGSLFEAEEGLGQCLTQGSGQVESDEHSGPHCKGGWAWQVVPSHHRTSPSGKAGR